VVFKNKKEPKLKKYLFGKKLKLARSTFLINIHILFKETWAGQPYAFQSL
jgi:hypothetical protein